MASSKKDEQAMTLEEMQAQMKAMLAEARAEAERIIAEAKAMAKGEDDAKKAEQAEAIAKHNAEMEELVEVKLFKDNGKYKDPVYVGVNGENVVIERGVRVKVKRKFAEALDNSDKQDYETSKLIERKSDEFSKSGL